MRIALVTGGCAGVGATTARAFHAQRLKDMMRKGDATIADDAWKKTGTYQLLPETDVQLTRIAGVTAPLKIGNKTVWAPDHTNWEQDAKAFREAAGMEDWEGERGIGEWPEEEYGVTRHIGKSDQERKRFLGQSLPLVIYIEGGPGALLEADAALAKGRVVLPIGCFGGSAGDFARDKTKQIKNAFRDPVDANTALSIQEEPGENRWDVQELAEKVKHLVQAVFLGGNLAVDAGLAHLDASAASQQKFDMTAWAHEAQEISRNSTPGKNVVTVLNSGDGKDLARWVDENGGNVVLIDGHGAKNQFKDMDLDAFKAKLAPIVEHLDKLAATATKLKTRHGATEQAASVPAATAAATSPHKWVAMYGGDPYNVKQADAAHIAYSLNKHFGVKIVTTQVDMYGKYLLEKRETETGDQLCSPLQLSSSYAHLDGGAIMLYETAKKIDAASGLQEIVYGGYDENKKPVGASKYWFDKEDGVGKQVIAHLVMGGGNISKHNADYCLNELKVNVLYIPCAAAIVPEDQQEKGGAWYGQVQDELGRPTIFPNLLTEECRLKMLAAPDVPPPFIELLNKKQKFARRGSVPLNKLL